MPCPGITLLIEAKLQVLGSVLDDECTCSVTKKTFFRGCQSYFMAYSACPCWGKEILLDWSPMALSLYTRAEMACNFAIQHWIL